jgi:hypothetical protein
MKKIRKNDEVRTDQKSAMDVNQHRHRACGQGRRIQHVEIEGQVARRFVRDS